MPMRPAAGCVLFAFSALLLQGCATTSGPGTGSLRSLPQARIELEAPELAPSRRPAATPLLARAFASGSRVLDKVLRNARSLTGTRYRYGGASPLTGFDCSGFVGYVYRESTGLELPRASHQMAAADGPKLTREQLEAGDLVFFAHRKRVDHVGIYLGRDRFIHAPSTGGRVRTDEMTDAYWRKRFVGGRRVLDSAMFEAGNATRVAVQDPPAKAKIATAPAGAAAAPSGLSGQPGAGAR